MVNGGQAGYMGMGWGGQNILPYIIDLLGPFREIWEYAKEISGNYQGKKIVRVWESLSYSSMVHVVRATICIPHL